VRRSQRASWRYWVAIVGTAALLAACHAQTRWAQPDPPGAKLRVGLLQGNIPQDEKFEGGTGVPQALDWYGRMLRDTDAQLLVAPETAIPLLPVQLPEGYLEALRDTFANGNRAALVGIPLGSFEEGYTNSVMGFRPGDASYRYHKHHLVPFGEFVPPLFKWFTRMMNIPLGDFNVGDVGQASFSWQGQRLAPNICYEDLFGEELGARFADPAAAPSIFVNVSNIAWFGNSIAIDQHLQISRMRALEFERPMIRATNTGATVIIDRFGRVTHSLPRHTRGVLVGDVEGGTRFTPFARWVSRTGLAPLWLLSLAAALVAWRTRTRRPQP
jgi:apolipoprotein N-acyltransferase